MEIGIIPTFAAGEILKNIVNKREDAISILSLFVQWIRKFNLKILPPREDYYNLLEEFKEVGKWIKADVNNIVTALSNNCHTFATIDTKILKGKNKIAEIIKKLGKKMKIREPHELLSK